MKLGEHVLKAIDAYGRNSKDEALMHATFAIDATARNLLSKQKSKNNDYKLCIRQYWWLIERFIGGGINLEETKWTHLKIIDGNGNQIIDPDLADIIYHLFRCNHAHAKEIPIGFELLPIENELYIWKINMVNNSLQMPESIIWALLAIAVFCKANSEIKTEGEYVLTWGGKDMGITAFRIKDWWGKEDELKAFFSVKPAPIRVKLNGL